MTVDSAISGALQQNNGVATGSDVTSTSANQDAQRTLGQQSQLADDFNDFLILLTTQIQNQDPLDPMDSAEFTNQLVQFSQVEQAINSNQKLDNLVQMQVNNASVASLSFIGMDITYPSAELYYNGETGTDVSYFLGEDVASANLNIRDSEGNLVYTQPVSTLAGFNEVTWDGSHLGGGSVEAGTYSVTIDATSDGVNATPVSTAVEGRVQGVESQNGIPFLLVGDRAIQANSIIKAVLPDDQEVAVVEDDQQDGA